ncbi:hypothetical protein I4F81_001041 [Pyropia yezoensis]|uniref:Uncharacterized protein n=1 Tax=Pyropia yezoensis TaxID=2788 RepID=A0ACC3BKF1_PYRYE|nr:hypothetical protein I4F81_001041 [Neopyropia yezoensis]
MMDKLLPLRANGVTLPGGYSPRRFTTTASRRRAIRGAFTIAVATLALLGEAPPAATHIVEAEAPPSARPQAAEPPQATTVDAAAGAAPQPPPYPLLGPVRKVVSEVGAPPAFDGHGELGTHPGVSCVVSDIYRFIYIIVHKAGSQTTRAYLMNSLCGTRGAADAPDSNCTTPLLNFRDTHARYTPCKNVPRSKFANYYVFSHTRNVWARAVSTYSFCRMGRAAGISWAACAADAAAAEAAGVTPEPSCRAAIGRYYAADVAAFGSTFEDMAAWGAVSGGGA